MHPDHFEFILKMMKAFIIASIVIYSFKLGRLAYEAIGTKIY